MNWADLVIGFGRAVASSVTDAAKSVLLGVRGAEPSSEAADTEAESTAEELVFGSLGVIGRPRPPDADGHADVVFVRASEGAPVIGMRDVRLGKNVNPKEGEVTVVGYGGAFISLKDNAGKDGTDLTIYVPRGNATKATAISVAAGNLVVQHESGSNVSVAEDGTIGLVSKTGGASIFIKDDEITITAGTINLVGTTACAPTAATIAGALPVLTGTAPGAPATSLKASLV